MPVIFSFFFHGRGFFIQKSSLGFFRSLLHQVLSHFPDLLSDFSSGFKTRVESQGELGERWEWHEGELRAYLETFLPRASTIRPIRIYVDALDEAGEQVARDLVAFFQRLTSQLTPVEGILNICFSCRHYPIVDSNNGLIILVEKENEGDIVTYVHGELQRRLPGSQGTSKAREIAEIVISRASNVFQWVVIVLSIGIDLCAAGKNMNAIRKKLQDLPTELHSLYQEILGSIAKEDLCQSLKLMQWICFARKPLSITELRFAIAVDVEPRFRSFQDMEENSMEYADTDDDMEKRIKSLSGGLAEVVSQGQTSKTTSDNSGNSEKPKWDPRHNLDIQGRRIAQFIHQSVNDYLLKNGLQELDKSSIGSITGRGHLRLSRACITYLAMEDVLSHEKLSYDISAGEFGYKKRELPSRQSSTPSIPNWNTLRTRSKDSFQRTSWYDPARSSDRPVVPIRRNRYRSPPLPAVLDSTNWKGEDQREFAVPPAKWPWDQQQMILHQQDLSQTHMDSSPLFTEVSHRNLYTAPSPLGVPPRGLHRISSVAPMPVVKAQALSFLSYAVTNWVWHAEIAEAEQISQGDLLALLHGPSNRIIPAWLQHCDLMNIQSDIRPCDGTTILHIASKSGLLSVVSVFVKSGDSYDIDRRDSLGWTPLCHAASKGYEAIVRLLLDTSNVDADPKDTNGRTPLSLAAENGHETIVKLLIGVAEVEVDYKDKSGRTPLSWAVSLGHIAVVKCLLETARVNVDSQDSKGRTPFSYAAESGQESMVLLLLRTGKFDVNSRDFQNRSALSWAAERGFERIVRLLLDIDNVEVDTKDASGRTPLSWAAEKNSEPVVRLLLNSGKVDVDPRDSRGRTPLSWAAERGSVPILCMLLNTGKVNVCSKGKDGWEPRARANLRGNHAAEKLLLKAEEIGGGCST